MVDFESGRARRPVDARPATIYAVAEAAGVSIATVSRVLRGAETASPAATRKVLDAARRLSYVPQQAARSLASRRYQTHALVTGASSGPYWSELVIGYEEAATAHGQSLLLSVQDPARVAGADLLDLRGQVDGVVVAQAKVPAEVIHELARAMPVVLVGRDPVAGCDLVLSESLLSATRLTTHLLEHGRQRLVFVGDPDGAGDVRDRYLGFQQAHAAAGLPHRRAPVRVAYTEQAGAEAARWVREHRARVDGVVCANDELALALVLGLREAGLEVGTEIAVTGWDDVTSARYVTPGLTTVRQPVREMGALAAELLHQRITDPGGAAVIRTLPTELVVRRSCGCAG